MIILSLFIEIVLSGSLSQSLDPLPIQRVCTSFSPHARLLSSTVEGSGRQGEGRKKKEDKQGEAVKSTLKVAWWSERAGLVAAKASQESWRRGGGVLGGSAASRAHHEGAGSPKERETTGGGFRVQGPSRCRGDSALTSSFTPGRPAGPCDCLGSMPGRIKEGESQLCLNSDFHITWSKELQLHR